MLISRRCCTAQLQQGAARNHKNDDDGIGLAAQWAGGKPRTCEDLKERYYKVARSLQVAWEGSEEGAANLTLVKHPFNAQHERCAPSPAHWQPLCYLLDALYTVET